MEIREFLEKERSRKEIFYYLLNCLEWLTIINDKNNQIYTTKFKDGFFKRLKAAVVYLEKDNMVKDLANRSDLSFFILKTKPALKYLLDTMTKEEIDLILFDNYCPVTIDELIDIYNTHIYEYSEDIINRIDKIDDENLKLVQYTRVMLMLPTIYVLTFEEDDCIAIEEKDIFNDKKKVAYLFSSKDEAFKYMKNNKITDIGIKAKAIRGFNKISDIIEDDADYAMLDSKYLASIEGIKNMEGLIID